MDKKKVMRDALLTFGTGHQAVVAIEELSELQKELCKMLRGKANNDHIAEEIADVEIMLQQMKDAFQLHAAVETWKEYKLHRLESRIAMERVNDDEK